MITAYRRAEPYGKGPVLRPYSSLDISSGLRAPRAALPGRSLLPDARAVWGRRRWWWIASTTRAQDSSLMTSRFLKVGGPFDSERNCSDSLTVSGISEL